MLRKGRDSFPECQLYLETIIDDFGNLMSIQNEANLRTIIRVVLFAFNRTSIECKVIDAL